MTYDTPHALRTALEHRLQRQSEASGLPLDRLRRRVIFQRLVARLQRAEPGCWVLKGGMALEVRLGNDARLTKDVDLGLRESWPTESALRDRLIEALDDDADDDGFVFTVGAIKRMSEDGGGQTTWRTPVAVALAGRQFGTVKLDVSPHANEIETTDLMPLPNELGFAGIATVDIEVIDVHRHAAEKFHAMLKDFGDRENSRVRDLADIMLLCEHNLLSPPKLATVLTKVWVERDATTPPATFPDLPASWPGPYERLAADHGLQPSSFLDAAVQAETLWAEMFTIEET